MLQEGQGKYKYYFLREDNPGKHKRISERLIKSFEDLCKGKRTRARACLSLLMC